MKIPTKATKAEDHFPLILRGFSIDSDNTEAEDNINQLDAIFEDVELGGNTTVPNIGKNTKIRYQFWTHLKYQTIVYREYTAIAFYKLKGWI